MSAKKLFLFFDEMLLASLASFSLVDAKKTKRKLKERKRNKKQVSKVKPPV